MAGTWGGAALLPLVQPEGLRLQSGWGDVGCGFLMGPLLAQARPWSMRVSEQEGFPVTVRSESRQQNPRTSLAPALRHFGGQKEGLQ